ncbi:hemolysin family protein [Ructibacterium gallinarum]|nr:hemolysin family protein [Ructibacterium gallinarum]
MQSSVAAMIFLQVILIFLNAVFACAEIAVISMNDAKLAKLAEAGDKRAVRLARLTSQPARFLATIQVAITLSGFLGSAFAAENFSGLLVDWLVSLGVGINPAMLDTAAVIVITVILSYFTLIFGELVPKRLAMRKAEPLALGMSALISGIAALFSPIVWLLTVSTNGILRLLGIDPNAEDENVGEEEIRMMVDVSTEKGAIDREEKQLIQNVFEFDDLTAGEIATHRTEISMLWTEESMADWDHTIHHSRHTLYPVCEDSADNVIGILNAKDYFRLQDKSRDSVMKNAVTLPYFVPETVKADVLFRNMKHTRSKLAVVLDEYGGMTGIVTINDLVEQLVGDLDLDEEKEPPAPLIEQIDSKTWKISGLAPLEEIAQALGIALPEEAYETFSGLVFDALGTIPPDGTTAETETENLMIKVLKIQDHQVKTAVVCLKDPSYSNEKF